MLERELAILEARFRQLQASSGIYSGERLPASSTPGQHASLCGFCVFYKPAEKDGGHEGKIDSQGEHPLMLCAAQRADEPSERPEPRLLVGNHGHTGSGIRPVAPSRNEDLVSAGNAEGGELMLPERLIGNDESGFVAPHAARFASCEENGSKARIWTGRVNHRE
jgi:hypothetical protein